MLQVLPARLEVVSQLVVHLVHLLVLSPQVLQLLVPLLGLSSSDLEHVLGLAQLLGHVVVLHHFGLAGLLVVHALAAILVSIGADGCIGGLQVGAVLLTFVDLVLHFRNLELDSLALAVQLVISVLVILHLVFKDARLCLELAQVALQVLQSLSVCIILLK